MDRDCNNNSGSEADGPLEAAVNGDAESNHGSDPSLAAEFSNEVGANIFRTEINISSTFQKVINQKSYISSSDFPIDKTEDTAHESSRVSRGSILKTTSAIRNFSASTYSKDSINVGNIESSPADDEVFHENLVNGITDISVNETLNDVSSVEKQNTGKDTNKIVEKRVIEASKSAEKIVSDSTNGLGDIEKTEREGPEGQRDKAPVKGKRKKRVAFAEDAEEHDDTTSGAEAASEAAAQSRLAQSHSNIEQLQQNLSTKLRSSTVETLRSELPAASPEVNRRRREAFFFAEGTDPAVWRKSAEEAASEAQTEFQVVVSHSPKPENAVVISAEIGVKQERANSLTIKDLPLDVKNSADQSTEETAVTPSSKSDDNIPYADSFADDEADNDSSPCFSPPVTLTKREESVNDTAIVENHKPLPKPQKVSWTTQLIERLSEEKETRRTPPKKPPRLVRYPGQKDFEENGKTAVVKTVVTAKPPQPKPRNETVDFDRRRIEDHTINDDSEDSDSDAQETERLRQKLREELKSTTSYIIMPESSSKEAQPQLRKAVPERGSGGNKTEAPPPKPKTASGSAFKRLLSPATNLFSSQRGDARRRSQSEDRSHGKTLNFTPLKQQKTPTYYRSSTSAKEDPQSMKPLLSKKNTLSSNHSRVKPISTSPPPMVETAFLSKHTDSPTKQNMYNSSKNKKSEPSIFDDEQQQKKPLPPLPSRSKSLSPARKNAEMTSRNIPQTSMLVEERLESIRRSLTPTAAPSPIPNDDNHFVGRRQQRNYQSLPPVSSEPKRTISKVQPSPKSVTAENVYANKETIKSEKSVVDAKKDPRINQNIHIQIPDDMYQHMIPKNAYYHSPPGLRGRNQLGIDASSVSSTSTIVSSVQDIRPHRQEIPSGRVSAPPGASPGWQATKIANEYGKPNVLPVQMQRLSDGSPSSNTAAGSPGGEPIYGQHQPKGLEPKRLSRQEIEALYWQTQLLREELAMQRRYLSGRGRQGSSSSLPGHYATPLARPQPVYGSHHRSRSASPGPYHGHNQLYAHTRSMSLPRTGSQEVPQDDGNIFIRGAAHRNTIATMRTDQRSTPTIYEEVQQQTTPPSESDTSAVLRRRHAKPSAGPNPIFKRGSLQSNSDETDASLPPPTAPKRVSFTPPDQRWPTRSGSAADPPTRQRDSGDSDVFLPNYVNLAEVRVAQGMERPYGMLVHTRPLPPTPSSNSTIYGVVLRKPQQVPQYADRWPPNQVPSLANRWQQQQQFHSESESGSEAGEIQRILAKSGNSPRSKQEEEWGADGKPRGASGDQTGVGGGVGSRDEDLRRGGGGGGGGGGRPGRRDDPRRHTLSGADHHQHHSGPGGVLARSMDLEMSSKSQRRKSPLPRGYPPLPSTAMLFDDDPGIMSEVETSSTGFRRGGKQRSSLPVVRTPSKTLERPLGKNQHHLPPPLPGIIHHHHPQMVQMYQRQQRMQPPQHPAALTGYSGGLVFLQYRSETKRALLPNEITSIDTVKALFVRSFPKQLTMEYLDSPHVKIYIHDSSKDMFYELEDLRSHLRDIRDRSVLRLFESTDMNGGVLPGAGVGVAAPPIWDQDQSYFSEPEFDSEYQHQHIHKSKASSKSSAAAPYYMTHSYPPGSTAATAATLPRGGPLLRAYSPAVVGPKQTGAPPKPIRTYQHHIGAPLLLGKGAPSSSAVSASMTGSTNVIAPPVPERLFRPFTIHSSTATTTTEHREMGLYSTPDRLHSESGYMSSPERGGPRAYPSPYSAGGPGAYEDPYYSQYAPRSGSITPVIDEEASDTELLDESYSLYGVKLQPRPGAPPPRGQFPPPASVVPYDATRIRVEHMERQLANLTGLVQKALTQTPPVQQNTSATPREYLQVPPGSAPTTPGSGSGRDTTGYRNDDSYLRSDTKPPKLGKDKSVSFEKSVSFSDEPPDMNSPKQHSPQHTADSKPTKPAIKSSTLPRMSSQERDRHKPAPPPKPVSLSPGQYEGRHVYRADLQLTPEMYNQLRGLQKKAKDLRQEVRNLRRMSQAQAHSVRETIRDTFIKIRAMLLTGGDDAWSSVGDSDKLRLSREEDLYKQEMLRLEKDLTELESTVEELRGNVINRKTRVNMSDVENMALILSKSSKTVADLKVRFPSLQEGMKSLLSSEMEKVVREEKFLKEEPERLESALRRCKKLTGTLVTLKRLASVQEQRLPPSTTPDSRLSPTLGGGGGGDSDTPITPPAHGKANTIPARSIVASTTYTGGRDDDTISRQRPENALDALLDELQTFARPPPPGNPNTSTTSTSTLGEIGRKGSVDSGTAVTTSGISAGSTSSLRRLHSYPSSSDCGSSSSSPPAPQLSRLQVSGDLGNQKPPQTSPKPPVPERNAELLSQLSSGRRVPPPPPPRTSSRSPLASPTSPSLPPRGQTGSSTLLRRGAPGRSSLREPLRGSGGLLSVAPSDAEEQQIQGTFNPASNSSSCESVNSQEGVQQQNSQQQRGRKELLEQRHQELLRKQRALQEQYARLQQLQRGTATAGLVIPAGNSNTLIPTNTTPDLLMLKKTGSESNLLAKMGLGAGLVATMSGSLTSLAPPVPQPRTSVALQQASQITQITTGDEVTATGTSTTTTATTTTSKIYETDIL